MTSDRLWEVVAVANAPNGQIEAPNMYVPALVSMADGEDDALAVSLHCLPGKRSLPMALTRTSQAGTADSPCQVALCLCQCGQKWTPSVPMYVVRKPDNSVPTVGGAGDGLSLHPHPTREVMASLAATGR